MREPTHVPADHAPIYQPAHRWQVRIISLLLVVEALGLGAIVAFLLTRIDWTREFQDILVSADTVDSLITGFWAGALILVLLAAAVGFALRRTVGWQLAMIAQGLTLAAALLLYFINQPWYVYPVLAYAIVMTLTINSAEIRLTYHVN